MERCFVRAGFEAPPRERTRPEAGSDVHLALAEDYKQVFQRLRADGLVEEPLYEGIADLLDALEADGWLLAVATGKSDRGLALCLDRHGLGGRFVSLQTADRHPSKPHPSMVEQALAEAGADPALSMMIGDTSYDMAMAKAAGVRAVGVAWGYHEAAELLAAGADYIARHPSEIAQMVK